METVINPRVRRYREGDAVALVTLWNAAHREYGGYVPRTLAYWNWCVLNRPKVSVDDVLVIEEGGAILGYGVLGPKNYVLEFAIEPTLSRRRMSEIATTLCNALEKRASAKGDPAIYMTVPAGNLALCEALRACDYSEIKGEFLNVTIVNPVALMQRVLEYRRKIIPEGWAKTFLLEFANGYYRFNPFPKVYVQIGDNRLAVAPVTTEPPLDCRINMSLSVFAEIIFKRLTFESAIESGQVTVTPHSELYAAQQLVRLITLPAPWYSPLADRR
jgi:ribosomal protein S18 acetylase RimI-like enzyme